MAKTETTLHRRNFLLHLQKRPGYKQLVLLKEPAHEHPTRSHLDQLHNEYAISSQLKEVQGVRPVYVMEGTESQPVLLMEYIQGQSMAELIGSNLLDMAGKLKLAINIATILMRIHKEHVMHKDISSGNVMISSKDNAGSQEGVYIIDFGIASTMPREHASNKAPEETLVGTLAYISPEQTGRMNRSVDYRADLYSLGVILYELFTGQLPFDGGDALEMIHAHIARQPQPPHQMDAAIPSPVSDIILKLLSKNAEDRYQTAHGLQTDLEHCLEQWLNKKGIEPFVLGSNDFMGRLQIPQKLYGRQAEIKQLQAILNRAIEGSAQLLFVAGYSGVGKTTLVHEIERDIIAKQAIYIEGKFDQLQRTQPYSAWAQAFTQLVNNWLSDSDEVIDGWRKNILNAADVNGQILIDVIPAIELIIGPQSDVPPLGGLEAQNRFNYIFNRFINGIATAEHPLVVFLDDLQWIDPASLNLMESLLSVQNDSNLLIIGAYRNNEVGPTHPLTASQERMQNENKQANKVTLEDLTPADTNQMLADTLHQTTADSRELNQALVNKTAGNPFYFRQQLFALESDGLLSFDRKERSWVWEDNLHQSLETGGNVVDLMIRKIQTLPIEAQQNLSMAACIGSRFKTSTLETITGQPQKDIRSSLNSALKDGLILKTDGYFSFAHDRVQEAGYAMIAQTDLPKTHLKIGRLLLADIESENLNEDVFEIVGHLNAGRTLIVTESEKLDLVDLNLKAARKARTASAFSDAKSYIEIALNNLGPDSWQEHYELTLLLYNELGELISYIGQYDQIEPVAELIHNNAKSIMDRIRIYRVEIETAISTYDFNSAVKIGLDVLKQLGFKIPQKPSSEDHNRLRNRYLKLLEGENPNEFIAALPKMTDQRALAASSILVVMLTSAFVTNRKVYVVLGFTGATLTLEHGVFPGSPHFIGQLGSILWLATDLGTPTDHVLDTLMSIRQMQEVALEMIEDPYFKPSLSKALEGVYHTGAYCRPIEENIELTHRGLLGGLEVGDLLFAAHGPLFIAMYSIVAGKNLEKLKNQLIEQLQFLHSVNQTAFATYTANFLQAIINFIEPSDEPQKLTGDYYDEDAYLSAAEIFNDDTGRHQFFAIRLMVSYHFDVDNELSELIDKAEKFITAGPGHITVAITQEYSALSKLRLYATLPPQKQKDAMNIVDNSIQLMEIWSQSAPGTFQHMYDLILAEKARVTGDMGKALYNYEQAIKGAHKVGFIHDEALANELYARFWAEHDNDRFASLSMREAHSLYRKWGAHAKAEHLAKRYPNWLIGRSILVDEPATTSATSQTLVDVDLRTVLKASQDISSEIALESLLVKLMESVIENAGAQAGFLILEKEGEWVIEAESNIDSEEVKVLQAQEVDLNDDVSTRIVNFVAHTKEKVVLDNAVEEGGFKDDPTIAKHKSKSILCIPLLYQGQVGAILYLANDLSTSTFTEQRVELLKMLSSQIVVTLTNALLFNNLEKSEEEFRGVYYSMVDVFTRSDMEGRCLMASPSMYDLMGYQPEEILGKDLAVLYADPAERSRVVEKLKESEVVENFEFDAIRKDGKQITVSTNANFYYDNDGKPLGIQGSIRDITLKKEAERKLLDHQKQLKEMSNQLALIEENQRNKIANDLHDSVGQLLASSRLQLAAVNESMGKTDILDKVSTISFGLRDAIAAIRKAIFDLYPPQLAEMGLLSALTDWMDREMKENHGISYKVSKEEYTFPLKKEIRHLLFRSARELLVNVIKHAEASNVELDMEMRDEILIISVKDDGKGFNYEPNPSNLKDSGFGLFSINERIEGIGGAMLVNTSPGNGTAVELRISNALAND